MKSPIATVRAFFVSNTVDKLSTYLEDNLSTYLENKLSTYLENNLSRLSREVVQATSRTCRGCVEKLSKLRRENFEAA